MADPTAIWIIRLRHKGALVGKFVQLLEKAEGNRSYLVAGQVWQATEFSDWDVLRINKGSYSLKVQQDFRGARFTWEYSRDLAPGVNYCNAGSAETVEEACQSALDFYPEMMTFCYLDREFICLGAPGASGATKWTFAAEGEFAEVFGPLDARSGETGGYFLWERSWAPSRGLLDTFCLASSLRGRKASFREAMLAAIDAPELFKRACGAMVSELRQGDKQ
jgi:hypothetical protein